MIELVRQPQSLCFTVYVWGEILKIARMQRLLEGSGECP